jgi:hypothetical protein
MRIAFSSEVDTGSRETRQTIIAFSGEVGTGSREENASNNKGKRFAHSMTKCAAM